MSAREHTGDAEVLSRQTGRVTRSPWRVAARCSWGYPSAIVSPSLLDDGTRFPNYAWLTCPWLVAQIGGLESAGEAARWAALAQADEELTAALAVLDKQVRAARTRESGGEDACAGVGLAGQRDFLGVKCIHAHVALALVGLDDPIGSAVLGKIGDACTDERCARLDDRARDAGVTTEEHDE